MDILDRVGGVLWRKRKMATTSQAFRPGQPVGDIAELCNGSTGDFGSLSLGSNPGPAAIDHTIKEMNHDR